MLKRFVVRTLEQRLRVALLLVTLAVAVIAPAIGCLVLAPILAEQFNLGWPVSAFIGTIITETLTVAVFALVARKG